MFGSVYEGRRVFVTGHTGFKGSWLSLWLERMGATVTGYALPPATDPNHFDLVDFNGDSVIGDIRDYEKLSAQLQRCQPEVVFHLAAQASVLYSYEQPLETFSSNIIGTAHLLEACRQCASVRAVVVVTTDKCYENKEWLWGYRENDPLGGHDPYSSSKAAAELMTSCYRKSYFSQQKTNPLLLASARAGNVVGGGDWTDDRLVPDIMRAAAQNNPVLIRNPSSSRPWQHVLEPLSGYLLLGQHLLSGDAQAADAWNFGPDTSSNLTVGEVVNLIHDIWPQASAEYADTIDKPREANLLFLDSTKAKAKLRWAPVWDIQTTLQHTTDWYRAFYEKGHAITGDQISAYEEAAQKAKVEWAEC